jgi:inner centromere protein
MNSLSQESLDETKKGQQNNLNVMLEEKRKAREEKQRQAQILRENMEKEKRELAIKQQQERDEKYRKIMREKEEKQRMEAMKKKMLKEKQAKKFAEEKTKKDEFLVPKPLEATPSFNKDDSLHLKMQKQLMKEKALQKKKAESKNTYSFDMLHTDDETDDESKSSSKRPPMPDWSKSEILFYSFYSNLFIIYIFVLEQKRKPLIVLQSSIDPPLLDTLFSVQPISVDLREIFPAIDSKKLIRNSSAIWRTPPKHYAVDKF